MAITSLIEYLPIFIMMNSLISSHIIQDNERIRNQYNSEFIEEANAEGRIVVLVYDNCVIMNIYFPANSECVFHFFLIVIHEFSWIPIEVNI